MNIKDIRAKDLREMIKNNADNLEIIDVREEYEYNESHIKGSKLIPLGSIQERANEIDWTKEVVFICRSGSRSRLAASLISSEERPIKNLEYGILECHATGGEFLEK